ncbi:MAG: hypothetical protein ABSC57_11775 [Syntrophales bacterium]
MNEETPDPIVSEHELRILIKALTKSVEYIHRRHLILTLIAGLLIGFAAGVLITNLTGMGERRLPEGEMLLKKSEDTLKELQQLRSMLDSLSVAKTGNSGGMSAVDEKVSAVPQIKAETVQGTSDVAAPIKTNRIHIQYALQKDRQMAEDFSDFLRKRGYTSVDTEMVRHKWRDIRYFHVEDRQAALLLQKQFNDFVADYTAAKGVHLKIKNLGKSYPRAQKGSLEVWVFF